MEIVVLVLRRSALIPGVCVATSNNWVACARSLRTESSTVSSEWQNLPYYSVLQHDHFYPIICVDSKSRVSAFVLHAMGTDYNGANMFPVTLFSFVHFQYSVMNTQILVLTGKIDVLPISWWPVVHTIPCSSFEFFGLSEHMLSDRMFSRKQETSPSVSIETNREINYPWPAPQNFFCWRMWCIISNFPVCLTWKWGPDNMGMMPPRRRLLGRWRSVHRAPRLH